MSALSFCTQTASTKRSPAVAGGKVGEQVTYLTDILIMPLMPAGEDIRAEVALNSPREAKETYCREEDIIEGDHLVVDGVEYIIRWVGEWPWPDVSEYFHRLAVEEVK
jgi:hypothetical protein